MVRFKYQKNIVPDLCILLGSRDREDAVCPLVVIKGEVTKERVMPYLIEQLGNNRNVDLDKFWEQGFAHDGYQPISLDSKKIDVLC